MKKDMFIEALARALESEPSWHDRGVAFLTTTQIYDCAPKGISRTTIERYLKKWANDAPDLVSRQPGKWACWRISNRYMQDDKSEMHNEGE